MMIGIDTNVLVRFLTRDDPDQFALAHKLLTACTPDAPAFVSREVMIETVWVLERAYRFDRPAIADALDGLLEARALRVEAAEQIGLALHRYRAGGPGFADHLIQIVAAGQGCDTVFTFDKQAAGTAGATLLA